MLKRAWSALLAGLLLGFFSTTSAWAGAGQPTPWQMGFQDAVTPVMEAINDFHNLVLVIMTVIVLFVLALLLIVMVRFNARSNPEPTKTSHNTFLEIAWTVVPILILLAIAVPSFRLLFLQLEIPEPDMTIKATAYQWYWGYSYPDHGDFEFDSYMLEDDELAEGQPRLLAVDNPIVVPVNKTIRVEVAAADVIHNFAMPSFGLKMDAIPGRLNETWFKATQTGTFYGQCSELCGIRHAFMPIEIRVVTEEEFAEWLTQAQEEFASAKTGLQLASAELR